MIKNPYDHGIRKAFFVIDSQSHLKKKSKIERKVDFIENI